MHPSFDERAATWDDDPAKVDRARQVAEAIRGAIRLQPTDRLLEYGAGTGLVSEALRAAVGGLTLADTSEGMRAVLQAKVASGVFAGARIWEVDLSTTAPPPERFDVIVTAMVLHHIADLESVLAAFAALLEPGGHLCIADLEQEDGSFHGDAAHAHDGFARDHLEELLAAAGFAPVEFHPCGEVARPDGTYPVFLAVATRR